MSKSKAKTKRSRGSAITDAARPAVPPIEPVKTETPAQSIATDAVVTESPYILPSGETVNSMTFEIPQKGDSWSYEFDTIRPQQDHATWRDIWKAAMTLAILFLGVIHLGNANRIEDVSRDGKAQYDATLRQSAADEQNIGHVWQATRTYGDYIVPDWSSDTGEIPAK